MGSSLRTAYIFLIINFIVFVKSTNLNCSSFPKTCSCAKNDFELYLNFHCPSSFNTQVEIKYKPNYTLEITCLSNIIENPNLGDDFEMIYQEPVENLDMLPDLNVGIIKTVVLKYCPIPENTISEVFQKWGITKVRNVLIEGSSFENISDTSKYFDSISGDVEALKLTDNEIKILDDGTFSNMTNLIMLDLSNNLIREINTQLNNLVNLKDLDLSRNQIRTLSNESFIGLINLRILHLWNNSIFDLQDGVFDDLFNLKSLELSKNPLRNISENIFKNLINLEKLNLGFNHLIELPANIFSTNKKLKSLRIESCRGLTYLPNKLLANLVLLENVTVTYSSLKSLPEDLFYNSSGIKNLILNKNKLTALPEGLIENLKILEMLQLNGNSLTTLPNDLFKSFPNLWMVDLSYNQISSELTNQFLSSAPELQKLLLQNNHLEQIQTLVFNRNTKLVELNLSHNKLTLSEFKLSAISLLNKCTYLENLDLSYNEINSTNIFPDFGFTKQNLKTLDMGHNKITWVDISELRILSNNNLEINLENNLIAGVELGYLEKIANSEDSDRTSSTVIRINSNPIICDCNIYDLVRYLNSLMKPSVRNLVNIKADNLSCGGFDWDNDYVGMKVESLKPAMLTCSVDTCPKSCDCVWRPHDKRYLINCSNRNLKTLPIIEEPKTKFLIDLFEINLDQNSIETFPKIMGYEKVKVLRLSHNKIRELTWIPPKVEILNLDHNNLSRLSVKLLQNIHNTTLHNNPWICDCKTLNLSIYIKDHSLPEKSNIVCKESNLKLNLLSEKDLCPTAEKIILGVTLGLSMLLLLTAVLSALYYKFNQEIKVWMFAHQVGQWLFHEEEIDRNKTYDAFISYSHVDEQFVLKEIINKLESGSNPYKLCIHIRNWVPGEFIQQQIIDSVQNSRRTIIVLSPDFLKSVWGQMEFRMAHTKAMSEGITRVIVIIYGDVDLTNDINEEMKAYLKTNTYIKWGDPWFWNKLRYALPHHKNKQNPILDKKMDNISLHLDSMDYINRNSTPNIQSKPEHPFLTKEQLNLKNAGDITSIPA